MPTMLQRVRFLRHAGAGYAWQLLLKRCGRKTATRMHGGVRFVIPLQTPGGVQLLRPGESWMLPLLHKLLPKAPGTFVDVGTNVGGTLLRLRAADATRPWIGFEPSPDNCKTVRALAAANAMQNTMLIEAAVSDQDGDGLLHGVSSTDASATLFKGYHGPDYPAQSHVVPVKLVNPANMADTELAARIGVIKIDVEGHEPEVMHGFTPLIQRDRPLVLCEILPVRDDGTARTKDQLRRQAELNADIAALKYRMLHIADDGACADVKEPRNDVTVHEGNYLLLPEERYNELRPLV